MRTNKSKLGDSEFINLGLRILDAKYARSARARSLKGACSSNSCPDNPRRIVEEFEVYKLLHEVSFLLLIDFTVSLARGTTIVSRR